MNSAPTLTVPEGIRLVTELEAERELIALGFTKAPCAECKGAGHFDHQSKEHFEGMARAKSKHMCDRCAGHGWNWKRPAQNQTVATCPPFSG
jgi:hypothetical protein